MARRNAPFQFEQVEQLALIAGLVDHQLEFCRTNDRKSPGLSPFKME
jgi:hypothetical protein